MKDQMNGASTEISAEKTNTSENDQMSVSDESSQKESTSDESSCQKLIKTESSTCNDQIGFTLAGITPNEPSVVSVTSNESSIEKSITDESLAQIEKQNANFADLQSNEDSSNENPTDHKKCDAASPSPEKEKHHVTQKVMTSSDLGCEGDNEPSLLCNMTPELAPTSMPGQEPDV